MRLLPLFAFAILFPRLALATGSCSWEDVQTLLAQAPQIRQYVESSLDIEPSGTAMRLGSHYANLSGSRVAPYHFRAKPKGAEGSFQFQLVIDADLTLFDPMGKALPPQSFETAASFQEIFSAIRLEPLDDLASSPGDLTTEAAAARVKWIENRYNEINIDDHDIRAFEFENKDLQMKAKVVYQRHPTSGAVQYITVDGTIGKNKTFAEYFYFSEGTLFLVTRQNNSWTYHPQDPSQTIDTMEELRYYFNEGAVFQVMKRKYEAGGPEKLRELAAKSPYAPVEVDGAKSIELVSRSSRLLLAKSAADVAGIYAGSF